MARPIVSRIGERFERLVIVDQWRSDGATWAKVKCDCGKAKDVRMGSLLGGSTRSCGCLVKDTRHSPIVDRVGQRFGRLTVLRLGEGRTAGGGVRWVCRCDCGNEKEVNGNAMVCGNVQSCGCLHRDAIHAVHGMSGTPVYKVWAAMKSRVMDPNNARYLDYGGRGITIHQPWVDSFEAWFEYVGPRPDGMSFDRINNDGNYEPGNVRWASRAEQHANRRPNIKNRHAAADRARIAELEAEIARLRAELDART